MSSQSAANVGAWLSRQRYAAPESLAIKSTGLRRAVGLQIFRTGAATVSSRATDRILKARVVTRL